MNPYLKMLVFGDLTIQKVVNFTGLLNNTALLELNSVKLNRTSHDFRQEAGLRESAIQLTGLLITTNGRDLFNNRIIKENKMDLVKQSKHLLYNIDMGEVWKDIIGYERLYRVSNLGRVKSSPRKYGKERILESFLCKDGYLTVCLSKSNKRKTKRIHHLVWENFSDKSRDGRRLQIDHIDGNKTHNCFNNLQLLTARENTTKAREMGSKRKSKYLGVSPSYREGLWRVYIYINGKNRFLGNYKSEILAGEAYKKEQQKISGAAYV